MRIYASTVARLNIGFEPSSVWPHGDVSGETNDGVVVGSAGRDRQAKNTEWRAGRDHVARWTGSFVGSRITAA